MKRRLSSTPEISSVGSVWTIPKSSALALLIKRAKLHTMDYLVEDAIYVHDHVIWLRFRDGTEGEVDLGPELSSEVFEPLRDVEYFKKFAVHPQCRTLVWPNDVDIAPEFLHDAARANPRPAPGRASDPAGGGMMTMIEGSNRMVDPMPIISRFLGVVISMYHREHGVPHFHATYGEHKISVEVQSRVVRGGFPPRALRHVLEWAALHEQELLANWSRGREQRPFEPIAPLE